jgi:hypothetical protein
MGLDQYLYAKKYYSPSSWRGENAKDEFDAVVKTVGAQEFITKDMPSAQVEVKVGYWRKSNQIHQWFVDNCQGGEDDCRASHVDRAQLIELRDLCEKVLADNSLANELLPCQGGFFFGSTEYDEWYYSDLRDTVLIVNECLSGIGEEWDFYYQSSW